MELLLLFLAIPVIAAAIWLAIRICFIIFIIIFKIAFILLCIGLVFVVGVFLTTGHLP